MRGRRQLARRSARSLEAEPENDDEIRPGLPLMLADDVRCSVHKPPTGTCGLKPLRAENNLPHQRLVGVQRAIVRRTQHIVGRVVGKREQHAAIEDAHASRGKTAIGTSPWPVIMMAGNQVPSL